MNEKKEALCKNCRFLHELKKDVGGWWKYGHVCTYFPQTDHGYDAFALVINNPETDMCELFMEDDNGYMD